MARKHHVAETLPQLVKIDYVAKAFRVSRMAIHGRVKRHTMFPAPVGQLGQRADRLWWQSEVDLAAKLFPPSNDN